MSPKKKNVWDLYDAVLLRNRWISAAKLTHNMLAFNYINIYSIIYIYI